MTKISHLKKYDVILMMDGTSISDIEADNKNLPSDIHAVTYVEDGVTKIDAVRAYKMTDIFDGYYDFGIKTIQSIESGYGSIKPKLYNTNPPKDSE